MQFTWSSQLGDTRIDQPRKLTPSELARLRDLGFPEVAQRLALGRCPKCKLSRTGSYHLTVCLPKTEVKRPLKAVEPTRQPWEPKPSTRAA